ncbi:DNA polymerase V [Histoplasma capsulatum]|uniref:DNA polymerase V n=1 Tax=Ajellomyces capsulatus TaxID=5037 RepID=A0A8A1MHX1_AJECA|nr:DNA polymerase V [Histoplasma capsulatum]
MTKHRILVFGIQNYISRGTLFCRSCIHYHLIKMDRQEHRI